jgi:hypothetical protein
LPERGIIGKSSDAVGGIPANHEDDGCDAKRVGLGLSDGVGGKQRDVYHEDTKTRKRFVSCFCL